MHAPANEVSITFVNVDGMSVAVGYVAQPIIVDGDISRTQQRYRRRWSEFSAALTRSHVMLTDPSRHLEHMHNIMRCFHIKRHWHKLCSRVTKH
jgi:hypothetical protein